MGMQLHPLIFSGGLMKNNDVNNIEENKIKREQVKESLLTSLTPFIFTMLLSIWAFLSNIKSIKENALWFGICSIFVILVDSFFLYVSIKIIKSKEENLFLSFIALIIAIISLVVAIICLIYYIWRINS